MWASWSSFFIPAMATSGRLRSLSQIIATVSKSLCISSCFTILLLISENFLAREKYLVYQNDSTIVSSTKKIFGHIISERNDEIEIEHLKSIHTTRGTFQIQSIKNL